MSGRVTGVADGFVSVSSIVAVEYENFETNDVNSWDVSGEVLGPSGISSAFLFPMVVGSIDCQVGGVAQNLANPPICQPNQPAGLIGQLHKTYQRNSSIFNNATFFCK